MPKLYLVGVTEDRSGLVLSTSRRAKRGDSVLEIDGDVLDAIGEIRRYRTSRGQPIGVTSPALPSRRPDTTVTSKLTPREIQERLRHGESMASVARRAGIEPWKVEVYAAPVIAEQASTVSAARERVLTKRGSGPSGLPLGEAVQAAVVAKKPGMTVAEFEAGWTAHETRDRRWTVRFTYLSRGSEQVAEWTFDPEEGALTAANRLGTTLGWRDPRSRARVPRLAESSPAAKPRRKAASKKKAPAKKKPVPTKKAPAKKKPVPKKPVPKKPAPKKKAPAKKTPVPKKKAPAKKKPVPKKKAPAKKKAPVAKRAAPRKPPARRAAAPARAEVFDNGATRLLPVADLLADEVPPPSWLRRPTVHAESAVGRGVQRPAGPADRAGERPPVAPPPVERSDSSQRGGRRLGRRRRPLRA